MGRGRSNLMRWLDEEITRRGREREVAALLNEMMVEEQLAELRRARGLSQARLAAMMGVKQPLVARMEAGRVKNLTLRTIARTAAALGARVEFVIKPGTAPSKRRLASLRGPATKAKAPHRRRRN